MVKNHGPFFNINAPSVAVSFENSLVLKTGSQRSEKPLYLNKVAPCRFACPIGVDIPRAFYMASKGDIDYALSIYLEENPLPGVCGRVCYHPCERKCNRGDFDEPVNIRSFERFLSDHGQVDITTDTSIRSRKARIAIVGSGPAGLSASYHLAKLGYDVTLFEAKSELGGMLRYGIPPYRLPRSILHREIERILSLGIQPHLNMTIGKDLEWKDLESFDAVFISNGLQLGKALFETDDSDDFILAGVDFLADPRKWFLEDETQRTLIIGGGNVAIDVARTLSRLRQGKGDNITILCPESRYQMPALPEEVKEALEEGITILNGWVPHKLHKRKGNRMYIDFRQAEVKIDEESGTVKIIPIGEEVQKYMANKIIVAIGQTMKSFNLNQVIEIRQGTVVTDRFGRTTLPKFFAGGDSIGGKAFVADAIASGKMGALAISCFLEGKDIEAAFEVIQIGNGQSFSLQHFVNGFKKNSVDLKKVVSFDHINTLFFSQNMRNNPDKLEPENRTKTFHEVIAGLKSKQAKGEIGRCFICGTCIDCENCIDFCPDMSVLKNAQLGFYDFDYDYCKGCGICSVACPRSVIDMVVEKNEDVTVW